MSARYSTAVHEAGHAIGATLSGLRCARIELAREGHDDDGDLGWTVLDLGPQPSHKREAFARVITYLAGPYAEARLLGVSPVGLLDGTPDYGFANQMIYWLLDRNVYPTWCDVWGAAHVATTAAIDSRWESILALGQELERKGRVIGPRIRQFAPQLDGWPTLPPAGLRDFDERALGMMDPAYA